MESPLPKPVVRQETPSDVSAITAIHEAAFERSAEARLVESLRVNGKVILSLVLESRSKVAGHILFTEVTIETAPEPSLALGLAPVSVLPEYQRQGFGSALIRPGLQKCKEMGHRLVVVLGDSKYYPRFGFRPASQFGLRCEYDVPDEVFMAIEWGKGTTQEYEGLVRYQDEFGSL